MLSLKQNIQAVLDTCFTETKNEIKEIALERILELISTDTMSYPQVDGITPSVISTSDTDNAKYTLKHGCHDCRHDEWGADYWDTDYCSGCVSGEDKPSKWEGRE